MKLQILMIAVLFSTTVFSASQQGNQAIQAQIDTLLNSLPSHASMIVNASVIQAQLDVLDNMLGIEPVQDDPRRESLALACILEQVRPDAAAPSLTTR